MAWTTALSPAKVNLFLEVGARRDDGYHDIDTVMVKVGLFDRLAFRTRSDHEIHFHLRDHFESSLPADSGNLVWQAIELLRQRSGIEFGLDVFLEKQIPVQAGLGGGSSNATTTLLVVNRLMKLGFGQKQLQEFGNLLGSDQAFFFASAAARCSGRGEHVEPVYGFKRIWVVLGMPPEGLRTGDVFGQLSSASTTENLPNSKRNSLDFCRNWNELSVAQLSGRLFNRLQPAAGELSPWIDRLSNEFARIQCRGHLMSGSGSGYFGIFSNKNEAIIARQRLRSRLPSSRFFLVPTIRTNQEPKQLSS